MDAVPSTLPLSRFLPHSISIGPCLKVTVPVTAPPYCPVTVATKMTVWPGVEGLGLEFRAVAVPALPTGWDTAEDTLGAKIPDPAYSAVMLWPPADNTVVATVASPEPFNVPTPKMVAPSLKVTVPAGTPAAEVTVAVNVTG